MKAQKNAPTKLRLTLGAYEGELDHSIAFSIKNIRVSTKLKS